MTIFDALPDDVLRLVLAALEFRSLGAAAQVCKRIKVHASEPVLLRKLLCQSFNAARWRVREEQLALSPRDTLQLCREPDTTPCIRLVATRSTNITIADDGLTASFFGDGLGGNRAVRADSPLPHSTYHALRPVCNGEAPLPATPSSSAPPAPSGYSDGAARTSYVLQRMCCTAYFEVTIQARRASRRGPEHDFEADCIAVGLCTYRFVRDGKQPGWDTESFGYHSDDGRLFHGSGTQSAVYGPRFRSGDVVGCGISTSSRRIFFTLNGEYLGPAFTAKPHQLPLFPVVGIDSFCPVTFNFGSEPFLFDARAVPASLHDAPNRKLRVSRCFGSFGSV